MEGLKRRLLSSGFDIVQPFRVSWYNQCVEKQKLGVRESLPLPLSFFTDEEIKKMPCGHMLW
jgi:hypothetical protein